MGMAGLDMTRNGEARLVWRGAEGRGRMWHDMVRRDGEYLGEARQGWARLAWLGGAWLGWAWHGLAGLANNNLRRKKKMNKKIQNELMALCNANGGILKAEDVVDFAKNPQSAMHSHFTWDDSEAAHQWRLHQARMLIRVTVVVSPDKKDHMRAYVSLGDDRYDGGGYRVMATVLTDEERRRQLLDEALLEVNRWMQKYNRLSELAKVFEAINALDAS